MIYFIGAGPGAVDLITVKGMRLLQETGMVIYAGSLVNPGLLDYTAPGCEIYNSAEMTLDEVVERLKQGAARHTTVVRLHTGDPSLFGAIREQMDLLRDAGLDFEVVPGVSSFCAAAAALQAEYTLPGVSQSLILSRVSGRTEVPDREDVALLASHQTSMVFFLSAGLLDELSRKLMEGGYASDTPAAIVYKASWPDQKFVKGTVSELKAMGESLCVQSTALVLVGRFLGDGYEKSRLYDPSFAHGFREAKR